MKKSILLLFILSLFNLPVFAQNAESMSIDQRIDSFIEPAASLVSNVVFYSVEFNGVQIPLVVLWLVVAALFFTFYFRFINIRSFRLAIKIVKGDYDNPDYKGEVSHFQALTAALSGTIGLGNIAGVAIAISLGGPGATFWMIVAGFLGMTTKFVECTLGVKYRNEYADGTVSGGPMYFLKKGFAKRNMPGLGKFLAVFFALMTIGGSLGGGNMFQGNQAAAQLMLITGGAASFIPSKALIGVLIAFIVGLVILGGIKSIGRVTEKIVPFMCAIYVFGALVVLAKFWYLIPSLFVQIFQGAFAPHALYGGIIGVMIVGFQRAAFSNEAGVGSASIAHSAVKTNEPVSEGIVGLLAPFIDTVIICTMTALVTIITGEYKNPDTDGIAQTSAAFGHVLSWFPYVLSVAVVLFAISTMISWSYYGLKAWTFLFGESKIADLSYKSLFIIFIVIGAAMEMKAVVGFSDAMIFAMSIPNIIGLYMMASEVRADSITYLNKIKSGEIKEYSKSQETKEPKPVNEL